MTSRKPPLPADPSFNEAESGFHQVRRDMEIIFQPVTARPPSADDHRIARASNRGRNSARPQRPWSSGTGQVAALTLFGLCQLAILAGALSSIKRDERTTRRDTSSPMDASRSARGMARSEKRSAPETTSSSGEGSSTPRRETRDGRAVSIVQASAPVSPPRAAVPRRESRNDSIPSASDADEALVYAFYSALARGDGEDASARVVAEKRSSPAFSPERISRFYSGLREPLRLTGITPLENGEYLVGYRYSAGRSRCDGKAVVTLASGEERRVIRSIRALNGC